MICLFFPFKPTSRWFKTKAPSHTEERAVGFKGMDDFTIQLYE